MVLTSIRKILTPTNTRTGVIAIKRMAPQSEKPFNNIIELSGLTNLGGLLGIDTLYLLQNQT
jgi:hypothetical protein